MKRLSIFAVTLALLLAIRSSTARAAAGEIIITHASMSTSTIPLWVAQRQKFFAKYGVNAKSVWVRGNPAQIATLVSGDTQIAYGGAPTAIAAAVGGRDMKIIASLSSRENLDLVARPGIQSAKDLRGKRFGVQSVGGGVWKTATVWLEHFGMDERRDSIQMIVIGDVTVLAQSLESGLIDATVVPGYLSRRLAEKGFVVLGRCEQTRLPSVGMTVLVEKPYLQQNAETLQNVMKALVEAMVFISSPKNKSAVLETIMKQFKMTDSSAAEGAYQDVLTLIRLEEYRKPYVSLEAMRTLQRLLKMQNPKIGEIKVENLIDASVIKKLDDSGFFEKLYAEYGVK
ncbi:MAG TPA: ABC transporter substrate-binding protein [Terriglobales bacterium]|nr:ABC transporter substrate-binding protein [Terriglobales bacterium]